MLFNGFSVLGFRDEKTLEMVCTTSASGKGGHEVYLEPSGGYALPYVFLTTSFFFFFFKVASLPKKTMQLTSNNPRPPASHRCPKLHVV